MNDEDALTRFEDDALLDQSAVNKYRAMKRLQAIFLSLAGICFWFLLYEVALAAALENALHVPLPTVANEVGVPILAVGLAAFLSTAFLYRKKIGEHEVSKIALTYHELAKAIEGYRNGEFDKTKEHLDTLNDMAYNHSYSPLHGKRRYEISQYLHRLENARDPDEAIQRTFEPFFGTIVTELSAVLDDQQNQALLNTIEQSPQEDIGLEQYADVTKQTFEPILQNETVRFTLFAITVVGVVALGGTIFGSSAASVIATVVAIIAGYSQHKRKTGT